MSRSSLMLAAVLAAIAGSSAMAGPLDEGRAAALHGDYAGALAKLSPLAGRGDARAEYELGQLYEMGHGVPRDYAKAADWYRKAADGGDRNAQLSLSLLYASGRGVAQDDRQGRYWLSKSMEGLSAERRRGAMLLYAMNRGGYEHGTPLTMAQIAARATPTLQRRANQGDPSAKCALLQLYETHQAAPRPGEDVEALRPPCAHRPYGAPAHPPPPALMLPPNPPR